MCLIKITEEYNPPLAEVEGYKVFEGSETDSRKLYNYIYGLHGFPTTEQEIPQNKWLSAVRNPVIMLFFNFFLTNSFHDDSYQSGFHFFKDLEDALCFAQPSELVVKIKARGVRLLGCQGSPNKADTYIADEIFIPEDWTSYK